MLIPEMSEYIWGRRKLEQNHDVLVIQPKEADSFHEWLGYSTTGAQTLEFTTTPEDFFKVEEDLNEVVPKELKEEFFFALKNGCIYEGVPSRHTYLINLAYSQYKLPNLIMKVIPKYYREEMFSMDYNLRTLICNITGTNYVPISDSKVKIDYKDYSEIYVAETDMVAAIPPELAAILSDRDIRSLCVDDKGIVLSGSYLCTLQGFHGGCPTYDLRELKGSN